MTFNNSFELNKLMDSAREEFDSVKGQLDSIESRVDRQLGGKTRGALVGAIFVTLIWTAVFLVVGYILYNALHPYAGMAFWVVSLLLMLFLLISDFSQIGYYGAILKARDRVAKLKRRVELGKAGLSGAMKELTACKEKGWDKKLSIGTPILEDARTIERQLSGMESVRHGFVHKMKNVLYYILCVGFTGAACYMLYDLAYNIVDGEISDKTLKIILIIATVIACVIEIFLAKWLWGKTHFSVNNATLFAILFGPLAFALLLLIVVLVIFLVQLVIGLLGVIIAGVIVFSSCSGG